MGRRTSWNPHDIDIVHGWMAEGKTTTGMAKLRPDWSKSSIKKLVARLKAAGCDTGAVYSHSGFVCPGGRAQGRIIHICLGCRLPVSQKSWGPPLPQRGGKAIQDRPQPRCGTRVDLCADVLRQAHNLPLDEIRRPSALGHRGCRSATWPVAGTSRDRRYRED